jgi:hypothetical protein
VKLSHESCQSKPFQALVEVFRLQALLGTDALDLVVGVEAMGALRLRATVHTAQKSSGSFEMTFVRAIDTGKFHHWDFSEMTPMANLPAHSSVSRACF